MKAIIRTKAGKEFSTMKVESISRPIVQPGELKIKMKSSRINPIDMDLMKGFPTLKYKKQQIGGLDGAGIVMEVGKDVTGFKIGDKVIFYRLFSDIGTWAEEITIKAHDCAIIPDNIQVEEAGAIAIPLLTAFESLQQLKVKQGEKILIHGVGGGVGYQALLVAKQMGLFVVGTASQADKTDLERAGLNQFIDYRSQDFTQVLKAKEVDYVLDTIGDEVLRKSIALLPRKIVSLKYVDTTQLHKAGVNLPKMMEWLIKMTMSKFVKFAKNHNVILLGQTTGANGKIMQKAINLVSLNFVSRNYSFKKIEDIEVNELSKNDIGKIIIF